MPFVDTKELTVKEPLPGWRGRYFGELEVTIAGETRVAGPGCVAVVPANQPHSVRARTAGRSIVVDSPRRDTIGSVETD